jgi:hypothetical protein
MQRYSVITNKIPREILLLKSFPCLYGKCSFCNYILDNSISLEEIESANATVIQQITGQFGVVEILNSGSVFELPESILQDIKAKIDQVGIKIVYFETYYGYRKRLQEIRDYFPNQEIRFRIGIETFDDEFRAEVLNKPFPTTDISSLANEFYACCLLICVTGQTREQILCDIQLARDNFHEITLNVFVNNDTVITRDDELVAWFVSEVYPEICTVQNIEILIDNRDLGVFVQ